jgi:PAS domain S-box-containing protein
VSATFSGGASKHTEAELAALARVLLEAVEDAVITVDTGFIVRTWSRGAERMYGWAAEEALGRDVGECVRLQMTGAERSELRRRTAKDGRSRRECTAERKDGSIVDVELITVAVPDEHGEPAGFLGVHRDISERKRYERDHRRLVEVVQASSELIGVADLEGRMIFVNEAGRRLVGLDGTQDISRTHVLDWFAPEDRALVRDDILPVIRAGGRWAGERYGDSAIRLRHFRTAAAIPIFWDCFRLGDQRTGEPFGFGMVGRDVSERHRAEAVLRDSEQRTRTILESVTDAFYAMDLEWRFTYLNEKAVQFASRLAGEELTREGLLGRSLWDTLPAIVGTGIEERYHRALREQQTEVFEYPYPGGGPVFDVHAYPSAQGLSVYFRDITAAKRAASESGVSARRQGLVANLGLRALARHDRGELMDEAVSAVSRELGVELTAIAELLPDGDRLLLRAGVGWRGGFVGQGTGPAGRGSLVGYTVAAGVPVVSDDVVADTRFEISGLLASHGAVSGVSVVIGGRDEPFGALGGFAKRRRSFSHDDINFMQAVANVLAMSVQRERAQERLTAVREAERRRIARDLHDEALQDLTHAMALAGRAGRGSAPNGLVPALRRVGEQLRGAIYDLRLAGEQDRPFVELLESLVAVHRAMATGSTVELTLSDGVPDGALGALGTEVLRILGEALTNARRHSGARNVRVEVSGSERLLVAQVSDDGRGADPAGADPAVRGNGIQGMRERAASLEAHLQISGAPGAGTTVRIEVPLPEDGEAHGPARVLLVEDHTAVRQAIAASFERDAGFEVVGQAASVAEAREMLRGVDVAVLDLALPDGYGPDLIADLRAANPGAQALVLSASLDRADIARAVESGAAAVLNKAAHLDDVVHSVRRLRAGDTLMGVDEILELLRYAGRRREREHRDRQAIEGLTPREREVLQALADGLDTQAIAERLHISVRTARNHMSNILAKLGVHSQLQALVFALRYDVIEIRHES